MAIQASCCPELRHQRHGDLRDETVGGAPDGVRRRPAVDPMSASSGGAERHLPAVGDVVGDQRSARA
jgi:hypothetical protein